MRQNKHKWTTKKGKLKNNIAKPPSKTSHTIEWFSATCVTYSTKYYERELHPKAGLLT